MAVIRKTNFVFLLGVIAFGILVSTNALRCKPLNTGIRMPSRKSLIDLDTFRTKVANVTWKEFYFGSSLPEDILFFGTEHMFTFPDSPTTMMKEYGGRLLNGTCAEGPSVTADAISDKAEFLGDLYAVFFGCENDLDSYFLAFECAVNRPVRRCPVDSSYITLFVKHEPPHSLPLHRALADLAKNTCLTLDDTLGDFRFLFTYAENTCPPSGPTL